MTAARAQLAPLLLGVSIFTSTGCPGELDPRLLEGPGPTICDGAALLKSTTCSALGCHGAVGPRGGLDLYSDGLVMRLLGKTPDPTVGEACIGNTMQYLVPGSDPAEGLLLDKLNAVPVCGAPMPYPLGNLPAAQRDCLSAWATAVTTGVITQ